MSYVVYWLQRESQESPQLVPRCRVFGALELTGALQFCELLRGNDALHVSLSSEDPNSVGKLGVDSVKDGKTPDGHDYTWKKRRV